MRKMIGIVFILTVLTAGCLNTKEAWPALINDTVLNEQGWVSSGDAVKQSETQNIAGVSVKINMAIMNYRDDMMSRNIAAQINQQKSMEFTSQLMTVRIVLPAGLSLPSEVVNNMLKTRLGTISSQNNIKDLNETGYTMIKLADGREVDVNTFDGRVDFEGGSIKIKGESASWTDSGSTIIVFGIMPAEDIVIPEGQGQSVTIKINAEQESEKMTKLIQNVK